MKVLFVRSGNNGLDPITQNQADSLINKKVDVVFFDIKEKGILGYIKHIIHLRKEIQSINPDIIHAHYSLSGFISALSFTKKPIVVSLMGSDVNNANILIIFLLRVFSTYFWNATIVKSSRMKALLKLPNIKVVPNGVDLNIFHQINKSIAQNKLSWESDIINILFSSDPERPEKNFDLACRSVELIKEEYNIKIHCLKNIAPRNMYLYYNAADVLLLTSFKEGSPNVIKEAMSCNCPIISTDVGDVSAVIGNTSNCYIVGFKPSDISKVLTLLFNNGLRSNGRTHIKYLDSKFIANRMVNIYESVIKNK